MHVVDIDLLRVGFERGVDVLVDEQHHVRLLHGNNVVAVQSLAGVTATQLLVEGQELFGGSQLGLAHLVDVLTVGALES